MKKSIVIILVIAALVCILVGCGQRYRGPIACAVYMESDGVTATTTLVDLTEATQKTILKMMNGGVWQDDTVKCRCNIKFSTQSAVIEYNAEQGVFNDVTNSRACILSERDRNKVNGIFWDVYYSAVPDNLKDGTQATTIAASDVTPDENVKNISQVYVTSGDAKIYPVSGMLWMELQSGPNADGTYDCICADGAGVAFWLSDIKTGKGDAIDAAIPRLTLNGAVTATVPVNGSIQAVSLIDLSDWSERATTLPELEKLEHGEYYIIMSVVLSGNCDPDAPQNKYCYEDIFKLIVE
jgi:hypothetical protein